MLLRAALFSLFLLLVAVPCTLHIYDSKPQALEIAFAACKGNSDPLFYVSEQASGNFLFEGSKPNTGWLLYDKDGNMVSTTAYEYVNFSESPYGNLITAQKNGKIGIIDIYGKRLVEHKYDVIFALNEYIICVKTKNGRRISDILNRSLNAVLSDVDGFVVQTTTLLDGSQIAVSSQDNEISVYDFSGVQIQRLSGSNCTIGWGGDIVVKGRIGSFLYNILTDERTNNYDHITIASVQRNCMDEFGDRNPTTDDSCLEGYYIVSDGPQRCILDKSWKPLMKADYIKYLGGDCFLVSNDETMSIYNISTGASSRIEGKLESLVEKYGRIRITFASGSKYSFVNAEGQALTPDYYEDASEFHMGYAIVAITSGEYFLIDETGRRVTKNTYHMLKRSGSPGVFSFENDFGAGYMRFNEEVIYIVKGAKIRDVSAYYNERGLIRSANGSVLVYKGNGKIIGIEHDDAKPIGDIVVLYKDNLKKSVLTDSGRLIGNFWFSDVKALKRIHR